MAGGGKVKTVGSNFYKEIVNPGLDEKIPIVDFKTESQKIISTISNAENFLFSFRLKTLIVAKKLSSLKEMPIIEVDDAQYEYIRESTIAEHVRRYNETNGYAIAVNFWHFTKGGQFPDYPRRPYARTLWGFKGQLDYQPIFVPYLSDTPKYYYGAEGGFAVSFEQRFGASDYVYIHGSYECIVSYDRTVQNYFHTF